MRAPPKLAGSPARDPQPICHSSMMGIAASTRVIKIRSCSALQVQIVPCCCFRFDYSTVEPETNNFLCSAGHFLSPKFPLISEISSFSTATYSYVNTGRKSACLRRNLRTGSTASRRVASIPLRRAGWFARAAGCSSLVRLAQGSRQNTSVTLTLLGCTCNPADDAEKVAEDSEEHPPTAHPCPQQ